MAHYHLKYGNPTDSFIEIEYKISIINQKDIFVQLPSWRPGRYELGNFAQNMFSLSAISQDGNVLKCQKITKDRWKVESKNCSSIIFKYKYAAVIKNAGGTFKSDTQFVITPVNCLIYAEDYLNESCSVSLDIPVDFDMASSMETTMEVSSYYELAATPILCSKKIHRETYLVNDTRFHICIEGNVNPNWEKLTTDFKKFTEDQLNLFQDFPSKDYYFLILIFDEKHYHGVEHLNSTLIALGPDVDFENQDFHLNLLGISSHELFHFWNICRIRPKEMMPYDYSKENYFETGYIAEGITTYYGDYVMGRSKTISESDFLAEIGTTLTKHLQNISRFQVSVAESSLDLWLDGYKPGIEGRKVSIYAKGATIALILDLWIRKTTQNKKSLDDVMRLMWKNHGKTGIGYTSEDYKTYIESVALQPVDWYFDEYVFGTVPVDALLESLLLDFGLELKEVSFEVDGETKKKFVLQKLCDTSVQQKQNYDSYLLN